MLYFVVFILKASSLCTAIMFTQTQLSDMFSIDGNAMIQKREQIKVVG